MNNNKLIAIIGPTASGKSDLAVFLAKKFDGEVISADSRQVYKYMDIGTGKITQKEMKGIPHYMLDVAHPSRQFTVAQFKRKTEKIIKDIQERGKMPIFAGGTGLYIDAVIYDIEFPHVEANKKLRKKLRKKSKEELYNILKEKDPRRAKTIQKENKRRLIRALEIIEELGKVPEIKIPGAKEVKPVYDALILGIKVNKELLHERIKKRLNIRLKQGMIEEVKKLRKEIGISWKRLENFGLDYIWPAKYLQGEINKEEMKENILQDEKKYARRQMVWFKRNTDIKWIEFNGNKKQLQKEAAALVEKFLN
ncbi:MAG: tRNA (adenosine(37)-N6)-dimethylallyltransferase MiaA [Candidatus Spechtbacterales bacterium]|nr:tRNA (adenosine(37)-N6)-dimethylallyltransferase MiaA [Candidatus Spechtbacterales bacterium]